MVLLGLVNLMRVASTAPGVDGEGLFASGVFLVADHGGYCRSMYSGYDMMLFVIITFVLWGRGLDAEVALRNGGIFLEGRFCSALG